MLSRSKVIFLSVFLFAGFVVFGQAGSESETNVYRMAFYNVENFFDAEADSATSYHEFEPDGDRHWTYSRYVDKRTKIYQVISALEGWKELTLVAFAEIENRFVLEDLIASTPLQNGNYKVIHFDSEDERGIDVGLIYQNDDFKILKTQPVPVVFSSDANDKTRDILYVKGLLDSDTLHVFINHWPSRYGGILASSTLREEASTALLNKSDSICKHDDKANILIMGDFNDEKENSSIQLLLNSSKCKLVSLPISAFNREVHGTLKYQGKWNSYDQIIISENLQNAQANLMVKESKAYIFSESFLLEEDKTHGGMKPKRTYSGYKYIGGFSDHLPVYVDIYTSKLK